MKEVVINGVEYLPATSLAKDFRYTTDYIGQLCRSKKVDAQLVGRSWYVNPLSLAAHKKARYIKVQANDALAVENVKVNLTHVAVAPSSPKKTTPPINQAEKNFARRIDWQPLKYEADQGELLPPISKETAPAKVLVKLADSTDIPIKISEKPIDMVAEALPEVSLSGVLSVTSIEDNFHAEASYKKFDTSLTDIPLPPEPPILKSRPSVTSPVLPKKAPIRSLEPTETVVTNSMPVVLAISPLKVDEEVQGSNFIEIILVTTSVALGLSLLVLFFSESNILASANSYDGHINFTTESFTALASFFSY